MKYRIATKNDLEIIWNKNINSHLNDDRWVRWKREYIEYNLKNQAVTFVVVDDEPVGEITMIISPECKAVKNKPLLADGKTIANMNAFRIEKSYEGKGHISKLLKLAENYARKSGIKELTIGVEATETSNIAKYLHWGFNELVMSEIDEDENSALILYYKKQL